MQACIMFPNNSTSLILVRSLLREDLHISLYCPEDVHMRMAHTIPLDLEFASTGLDVNVRTVDTLDHLEDMDFVVFPALDVLPEKKRSEFAGTLKELFRLVN